ncbi:MAG: glycerol-3-phosphate dehydrogenase/oxidase [Pseudomonadota bacterium]
MSFSFRDRSQNLQTLSDEVFDLAIVGGGITGAGVARDAASRGMKVALVESQDFASGTSSRSSKLIHGGVRYLENFEFHLVFEALSERALLFKIAPHLVHPLRFLVPVYSSSRVGFYKMLAGMWLYDLLALFETPQMHESLDPQEVRERVASIDGRGLVGAVEYSDAYTDDDRLVIESLRDAHRRGATIVNFCEVEGVKKDGDKILSLSVRDKKADSTFNLRAKQFVAGVGPWTDLFGKRVDDQWSKRLRPTKGVHLVFSKKKIPIERAVVLGVEERIIFVIPRHEMVIVGTTDTDYSGDPGEVRTHNDDVNYILHALKKHFPRLDIGVNDILSTYSGVRPLIRDDSSSEGKTSREHKIFSHGSNLTFVAGGKYTTYRKISEEVVDFVLEKIPFEKKMAFGPCQTKTAINPFVTESDYSRAQLQWQQKVEQWGLDEALVKRLLFRHGSEAEWIFEKISKNYNVYSPNESLWMGEAAFAIQETMCLSLEDYYWRRSPLFLAMRDHGMKYLDSIAKVFAEYLGWDADEMSRQKKVLMEQMQSELDWKRDRQAL